MTDKLPGTLLRNEAYSASIMAVAPDAIISVDSEQRIQLFNPGAERIFGYQAEEVLGQPLDLLLPERFRETHRAHLAAFAASPNHTQRMGEYREVFGRRKDSSEFPMEASIGKTAAGNQAIFTVILRDISERKQAEQRLRAQYEVTRALAETVALDEAAARILQAICEGLGWGIGELWIVDRRANVLRFINAWSRPALGAAEFEAASQSLTFAPGAGLPGRAWASGEPAWMADVAAETNFYRAPVAARLGLHGACAFPIQLEQEVLGVMAFFCREIRQPDEDLLRLLAAIGGQIGQFIKRQQAEMVLAASEKRFRALIENSNDAVALLSADGTILYESPSVSRILGRAPAIGHNGFEGVHADDLQRGQELFARIVQSPGASATAQVRYQHQDGSWRWLAATGTNLLADPAVQAIVVNFHDITDRQQAEAALRESEAGLAAAQRIAHVGNWDWDIATNELRWSDEIYRIFGLTRQAFGATYEAFLSSVHPDDREFVTRSVDAALHENRPYRIDHRILLPDGQECVVHEQAEVTFDEAGRAVRMIGTVQDITERVRAEASLRKLSSAIEQTADPVVITDVAGTIEYVNAAFTTVAGYRPEEVLGQNPRLLKSGAHPPDFYRKLWDTILAGDVWWGTVVNRKKDGETYIAETSITPIRSPQGQIVNFVSVEKDVTARKRRERELEAIVRVSTALRAAPTRSEMLPIILDQALDLLGMQGAALALRDPNTGATVVELARGEWTSMTGVRLQPGEGVSGLVIATGQSYVSSDVQADARIARPDLHGRLPAAACVPLIAQDEIIGALWIGRQRPIANGEVRLLTVIAEIAANALHRAALHETEREQARRLAAISQVVRQVSTSLDLDELLRRAVDLTQQAFDYYYVSVLLVDAPADELVLRASACPSGQRLYEGYRLTIGQQGISGWVVASGQPLLVNDVEREPRYHLASELPDTRSELAVPIVSVGKIIGVLDVQSIRPGAFNQADLATLQTFAGHLAAAIENARLYMEQSVLLREREQAQAQLIQSEKIAALGRLVASLAHEVNNPLQSVQGCLTLAGEELQGDRRTEKMERYLDVARTEIERLSAIVQRMRDFYRPARVELVTVDVHDVLGSVLALVNKQLQHANVMVERQWAEPLPNLQANPDHLKQVFLNLALNAIEAMPGGGVLSIRTAPDEIRGGNGGPAVCVQFNDTGRGMPPEVMARVFEPFFTAKEGGTGLGLSVSYSLIQSHHGQITVSSTVGVGTTFVVLLPIHQPAGAPDEI